jgi:Tfp pilus assembly major pilin PilA
METNSSQNEELYRAAVGKEKADYYLPLFQRFDQPGSSGASWNWLAFFFTFFWMLYRRMFGLAVGYLLLLPIVFGIVLLLLVLFLGQMIGTLVYWVTALGVSFVVIPMFANSIYHRHVKRRIARLAADAPSQEALLQRVIGHASTASIAVIVGAACVYGVAILGILAAIAIPAYQDYTIRAQVGEGLALAGPVKALVARTYASSSSLPADLQSAGLDAAPDGKYVSGIEVSDGTILIRYGNAAHARISGHTLALQPLSGADGLVWSCGYAGGNAATQTDIEPRYLPSSCRMTIEVREIVRQ